MADSGRDRQHGCEEQDGNDGGGNSKEEIQAGQGLSKLLTTDLQEDKKYQDVLELHQNKRRGRSSRWELAFFRGAINMSRANQTRSAGPGASFCY